MQNNSKNNKRYKRGRIYNDRNHHTYPDSIEYKIGFDSVRRQIDDLCLSDLGKIKCAEMVFSTDYSLVSKMLEEVKEMLDITTAAENFPLGAVHDVTPQLKAIKVPGTHISEADLPRFRNSLSTIVSISDFFNVEEHKQRYPRLSALASAIADFSPVAREIDRVIDKFGYVKDNASPELAHIRAELASMAGSINAAMRRVIARAVKDGLLDTDTTPSLRDGRPVIPVAPMNKRRIPGIVHDESASGKTYFIEPTEVVEASNRMRELQLDERREVLRILVQLADMLRPHLPDLLDAYDILGEFDFINAKTRFAMDTGGMMPHLHKDMQMEWYHACHPVLMQSLRAQGKEIVPLDIRLTPQERILVVSGPNAGGKSVTLKTVAIVQYMAQSGILPPVYENSHLGIADKIYVDIGDDQSMEDDLSTYSSHLENLKYFLSYGNKSTLVLIDEFGSGTEPQIGGAIAQAVLARFAQMGMWGVITTHFQNLKQLAEETDGLVNGSMLYDRQQMRPLFKLTIGNAGSSFAIEIARKIGLPEDIIKSAEEIVGSDYINIDKYLLDIARDKRYWENKRMSIRQKEKKVEALLEKYDTQAEELRLKRREIIDDARDQARKILEGSNAAIERTIHDIKKANAEKEKTLEARRKLEAEKAGLDAPDKDHPMLKKKNNKNQRKSVQRIANDNDNRPITVGDNVLLDGAGTVGKVISVDGSNAVVAFGILKTTVKVSRLKHTMKQVVSGVSKAPALITSGRDDARSRQLGFNTEIDVRGMRADEAIQAVMYFVDDAVQYNASRIRILHGTGTGALRQSIRAYLDTIPAVTHYADEDVRFGGAGITVVDLV